MKGHALAQGKGDGRVALDLPGGGKARTDRAVLIEGQKRVVHQRGDLLVDKAEACCGVPVVGGRGFGIAEDDLARRRSVLRKCAKRHDRRHPQSRRTHQETAPAWHRPA